MAECNDDVPNGVGLLRRIRPGGFVLEDDSGVIRPQSDQFTFHRDDGKMSVFRESEPSAFDDATRGHAEYSLVRLQVDFVRSLDLKAEVRPSTEEPSHGNVCGSKLTAGQRSALAKNAPWVIRPPDSAIEAKRRRPSDITASFSDGA